MDTDAKVLLKQYTFLSCQRSMWLIIMLRAEMKQKNGFPDQASAKPCPNCLQIYGAGLNPNQKMTWTFLATHGKDMNNCLKTVVYGGIFKYASIFFCFHGRVEWYDNVIYFMTSCHDYLSMFYFLSARHYKIEAYSRVKLAVVYDRYILQHANMSCKLSN